MKIKKLNVTRYRYKGTGRLMKPFESYFLNLKSCRDSLKQIDFALESVIAFFERDIDELFYSRNSRTLRKSKKDK